MSIIDKCCEKCWHSEDKPCPDYVPCRTLGPLCHSDEDCKAKIGKTVDRITYGDHGFRINVGMGTCGLASGAQEVYDAFKADVDKRGLKANLVNVGCIGSCYAEVLVEIVRKDFPAVIYSNVEPKKVAGILDSYLKGDVTQAFALRARFGKFKGEEKIPLLNSLPFFKSQVFDAMQNCGIIDPESIEEYIVNGGYLGLTRMLKEMTPEKVIAAITSSKLRGRGGAGFPTGIKLNACYQVKADKKYMICNADEGDPGAFMNRLSAEGDPHRILEGLMIAAYAIGANEGYIFVRTEKPLMAKRFKLAVEQARQCGLLGNKILGSNFSFDVQVMLSAGAFVCGEETALMSAIEGKRAFPRPRPPFPATKGLWNLPTTIDNVETLAHIPTIIAKGAAEFAKIGTDRSKGTKVFCLTGKVSRTGAAEVPIGTTVRQMVFDIGGGTSTDKKFKAVQTGGPSGGCLSEQFLDVPVDYETLQAVGSIMGSGGIVVLDEDTCIVDLARYFLTFTTAESCGECTPCREGLKVMLDILTRITEGKGEERDLELLQSLSKSIMDSALCALGKTAPNPVLTTMKYFREEYEAHIREKKCPAHVCTSFIKSYSIIPERCTACGLCIKECPEGAIEYREVYDEKKKDTVKKAVINAEKCRKCGQCFSVCPLRAVEKEW
ncbi:MAG: NADH-ubiquinone oxidoreductase-F iron-sulfur binding region domain-containing protein [Candidatus Bathyarchaeota archaeon]